MEPMQDTNVLLRLRRPLEHATEVVITDVTSIYSDGVTVHVVYNGHGGGLYDLPLKDIAVMAALSSILVLC
jgi:hypothetical protein